MSFLQKDLHSSVLPNFENSLVSNGNKIDFLKKINFFQNKDFKKNLVPAFYYVLSKIFEKRKKIF